ncbi:MAG: arsenate reductase ArsC [Lacipirellulaceae bacterium]
MSAADANLPHVLFLCTGNSCRSQMAEGWGRELLADRYQFYSAGIEAHGLNPNAVEVMRESGVDISGQRSQTLEEIDRELGLEKLNIVITVCGHADENCPVLPINCTKHHMPFDDPPKLAKEAATPEEAMSHYRRVRDEIREQVAKLPEIL